MRSFYCILLVLAISLSGYAQTIQNLNATFSNGKVTITYDVTGAKPSQTFSVQVYSSYDNYASQLKQVTGDVGKDITAGSGKRIIWDASTELGTYSGQLSFKLKGEMNVLPWVFKTPTNNGKAKMGKALNISWEGGHPDQNVKLTVLKGNDQVVDLGETKNTGSFAWKIPKKFEKGTYSIKLTADAETKQSGFFAVKSQPPILFIAIPVVVVGAVVAILGSGGGGGDTNLPVAPDPN